MSVPSEKLYYSISEVSESTGVKAHVLRYWESQFSMLRPRKSRGGMRMYRAKDVAIVDRIRHLLYERGFTIAGARRQLLADRRSGLKSVVSTPRLHRLIRAKPRSASSDARLSVATITPSPALWKRRIRR